MIGGGVIYVAVVVISKAMSLPTSSYSDGSVPAEDGLICTTVVTPPLVTDGNVSPTVAGPTVPALTGTLLPWGVA